MIKDTILRIDDSALALEKEKLAALKVLDDFPHFPEFEQWKTGMEIIVLNSGAAFRKIQFEDCPAHAELRGKRIKEAVLSYSETQSKYTLAVEFEDDTKYYLRFTDIKIVKSQNYNCAEYTAYQATPWVYLAIVSWQICDKAIIAPDMLNKKEQDLLPLLKELEQFVFLQPNEPCGFPILHKLAVDNGFEDLGKFFIKAQNPKGKERPVSRLILELSKLRCKPLWNVVCSKIKESQQDYPCPEADNKDHIKIIDSAMHEQGFEGSFPDYVKTGILRKNITADSHGSTHTISKGKTAIYHVHCQENTDNGELIGINFLCGTAVLKEGAFADETDIYYCAFDSKGKNLFDVIYHYMYEDYNPQAFLKNAATVAAKRAQRIKLNKSEKAYLNRNTPSFEKTFLTVFLFGGGFFSIGFTLLSLLVALIAAIATGENAGEFLKDIPWLFVVVFTWIGFGGAMGLITAISSRK